MRYALLSGGINQIDTGHYYRDHRAEYVVGQVLKTMFRKFGLDRSEIFVTSKQGFIGDNSLHEAPSQLVFEELRQQTELEEKDFFLSEDRKNFYSFEPAFLDFSLNYSSRKMGLETIDCAVLDQPYETTYYHDMEYATRERRQERYFANLARAFEFYE